MSETSVPARQVQRLRHEIKRRELTVLRVERLTPHFQRITLGGESLADFISASFDDHAKLIFDAPEGVEPAKRDYTPRAYDNAARELVLEFALHGEGPAADWALQAQPGQTLVVAGPRGSMVVPVDYDWHLLIGDESALPAVARRLEELPAGTRAIVMLQLADAADRRVFSSAAEVELHWPDSPAALFEAVRALGRPAGEGYVWGAGEAAEMKALREVLVGEIGHDPRAMRVAAYWKRGAIAHHGDITD